MKTGQLVFGLRYSESIVVFAESLEGLQKLMVVIKASSDHTLGQLIINNQQIKSVIKRKQSYVH